MWKRITAKAHKSSRQSIDKTLVWSTIALCIIGLVAVFNSSVVTSFRLFGTAYHFIYSQAQFLFGGLILAGIISKINYHRWYVLAVPLLFITLLLLVAVFIPGLGVKALGAKRWVDLGFIRLQPTEFAKFSLVIYLSAWFSHREKKRFTPFLVLLGLVLGLVMIQPDMGTAIIICTIALLLYFVSGAPVKQFMYLLPVLVGAALLVSLIAPYRFARLTAYLNPMGDPLGSSYHIRQVLIAIGSGGWFGVGLGKSKQKYDYVPEANTDSIFAIIAEEVGFVGALVIIGLFCFFVYRIFTVARNTEDRFGRLLASGVGIWFAAQTLINLGAMVALIPLTGIPLPLISYGGSNVLMLLSGLGIVYNISRGNQKT